MKASEAKLGDIIRSKISRAFILIVASETTALVVGSDSGSIADENKIRQLKGLTDDYEVIGNIINPSLWSKYASNT